MNELIVTGRVASRIEEAKSKGRGLGFGNLKIYSEKYYRNRDDDLMVAKSTYQFIVSERMWPKLKHLRKGDFVYATGHGENRKWKDDKGTWHHGLVFYAHSCWRITGAGQRPWVGDVLGKEDYDELHGGSLV